MKNLKNLVLHDVREMSDSEMKQVLGGSGAGSGCPDSPCGCGSKNYQCGGNYVYYTNDSGSNEVVMTEAMTFQGTTSFCATSEQEALNMLHNNAYAGSGAWAGQYSYDTNYYCN